jgi:hypothetical protein
MGRLMQKLIEWLDRHLIDDWAKAGKFASVRFGAYSGVLASVWATLSDDQRSVVLGMIGVDVKWLVPIGIAVAVILRLKRQE